MVEKRRSVCLDQAKGLCVARWALEAVWGEHSYPFGDGTTPALPVSLAQEVRQ